MALPTPIQLQASTTIASAAAGTSNDISGITATDATLELNVTSLTAVSGVPACTFAIEDSVDAFTNKIQRGTLDLKEAIVTNNGAQGQTYTWRLWTVLPNLRIGVGSAVLRINVLYLAAVGGATPSLTYNARLF